MLVTIEDENGNTLTELSKHKKSDVYTIPALPSKKMNNTGNISNNNGNNTSIMDIDLESTEVLSEIIDDAGYIKDIILSESELRQDNIPSPKIYHNPNIHDMCIVNNNGNIISNSKGHTGSNSKGHTGSNSKGHTGSNSREGDTGITSIYDKNTGNKPASRGTSNLCGILSNKIFEKNNNNNNQICFNNGSNFNISEEKEYSDNEKGIIHCIYTVFYYVYTTGIILYYRYYGILYILLVFCIYIYITGIILYYMYYPYIIK